MILEAFFEKHLLVDWFNVFKESKIIEILDRNHFKNIQCISCSIEEDERIKTMSNFYRMKELGLGSWQASDLRGKNEFFVYFFEDHNPKYNYRETTKNFRLVNINTFDLKKRLRKETKSLIHITDNIQETKDNLRTLNLYEKYYKPKNFKNLNEVFKTLNETPGLEWLILRNFENFPNNLFFDEHPDVDLLVNDFYLAKNALDADAACKKNRVDDGNFRVLQNVIIENKEINFDLRFIGDDYYDEKWQIDMLKSRTLYKNFYIPEKENYLNSLLYHALIHKKEIHPSYSAIFNSFNLPKERDQKWYLLNSFMKSKEYIITRPEPSVFFNFQKTIQYSDFRNKLNTTSKRLSSFVNDYKFYEVQAKVFMSCKRFDKAQEVIKQGLERFPNQLNLLTNASDVYRASGDFEGSLFYANLLMKHHPGNWNGYARGAQDLRFLKQFDKAIEIINLGIKYFKENKFLFEIASNLYREKNQFIKSLAISKKMVKLNQDDWYWNERLATDYRFTGCEEKASIYLRKTISYFPTIDESRINIFENYNSEKNTPLKGVLYLLAGCSGSGKTTFLNAYSDEKIKLFYDRSELPSKGIRVNSFYQYFKDPLNSLDEWTKNLSNNLNNIFSIHQINDFRNVPMGKDIILHVDIRDLIRSFFFLSDAIENKHLLNETRYRGDLDLLSKDFNKLAVNLMLRDSFFKKFKKIYVTTIQIGFKKTQERFEKRLIAANNFSDINLFKLESNLAEKAYLSIYYSWIKEISILNPVSSILITEDDENYNFKDISSDIEQ